MINKNLKFTHIKKVCNCPNEKGRTFLKIRKYINPHQQKDAIETK